MITPEYTKAREAFIALWEQPERVSYPAYAKARADLKRAAEAMARKAFGV